MFVYHQFSAVFFVAISLFIIIFIVAPQFSYDYDDCCSVCGSHYAEDDLYNEKDITWDYCGGLDSALKIVWNRCNAGDHKGNLKYLEAKENISKSNKYPD